MRIYVTYPENCGRDQSNYLKSLNLFNSIDSHKKHFNQYLDNNVAKLFQTVIQHRQNWQDFDLESLFIKKQ